MDSTELFTCYNLQQRLLFIFKNFKIIAKIQEKQLLIKVKSDLKFKIQKVVKCLKNEKIKYFIIHILKAESDYLKDQNTTREVIVKNNRFSLSDIAEIANAIPIYKV